MIVDDSFSRLTTRMIVHDSFSVSCFPRKSAGSFKMAAKITSKQAAALFRRDKFILLQFVSRDAIFVTFLGGKSLELAARVTLLARLPVNYRQLSRSSLAV